MTGTLNFSLFKAASPFRVNPHLQKNFEPFSFTFEEVVLFPF